LDEVDQAVNRSAINLARLLADRGPSPSTPVRER
jgi:hypothetical protein